MTGDGIYRSLDGQRRVESAYREVMTFWPVPSRSHRLPTRHGWTHVTESGPERGEPLVLLHGSGANSASWGGDVAHLAERYRVLAVDMIGEPGFSEANRPALDSDAYVEWMDDVLRELDVGICALAGLSLGGWLALTYACSRPERVRSLVLICPGGLAPARRSFMVKVLAYGLLGRLGRKGIRRLVGLDALEGDGESGGTDGRARAAFIAMTEEIAREFRYRRDRLPIIPAERLGQLSMPVRMFFGTEDALLDASASARVLACHVPGAEVVLLPGRGHVLVNLAVPVRAFFDRTRMA